MAEILPNTSNDIGNRGCTNETLAQFKGKPRQVLVNISDGYRLVVMDGSTLGGKFKTASLEELTAVKTTADNALTKTLGDSYYLAKTGKAVTAGTADKANVLTTARTIGITGAVTGTATAFNGSANISINATGVDGTKVSTFTGATSSTAGTVGAVPAPAGGANEKYLRGDGTWQIPTNTNDAVTQTVSTTEGEYPLLAKATTAVTTVTDDALFAAGVTVNPSTKTVTATTFKGALVGNASTATKADSATKATQDASGNDIAATYETKANVSAGLNEKLGKTEKAASATVADSANAVDWGNVSNHPDFMLKNNNRGAIAGYETVSSGASVSDTSPDSQNTGSNVTVNNGTSGTTWTKVVYMTGGSVTLGGSWKWVGNSAPTLKYPGVLACHWNNTGGIAVYTAGA